MSVTDLDNSYSFSIMTCSYTLRYNNITYNFTILTDRDTQSTCIWNTVYFEFHQARYIYNKPDIAIQVKCSACGTRSKTHNR